MKSPSSLGKIDSAIEVELDRLTTVPIVGLRSRYKALFGTDPPKAFGPDLLRRCLAHRIQTDAYGGLSRPTQRLLDRMAQGTGARSDANNEMSRRIKSGSEIVRTWKGRSYRVTVMHEGFAYEGKTYPGLSEIASLITGTRWNGPRFFGLRTISQGISADGK
jgi:hypothetical protein